MKGFSITQHIMHDTEIRLVDVPKLTAMSENLFVYIEISSFELTRFRIIKEHVHSEQKTAYRNESNNNETLNTFLKLIWSYVSLDLGRSTRN